jgi:hypothetical protein
MSPPPKKKKEKESKLQATDIITKFADFTKLALKTRPEFFMKICGDNSIKSAKLTKAKFKTFLAKCFGENLAEKLSIIIDFNKTINFDEYIDQIVSIMKDRSLML